jgi:hypothetical protein
MGASATTYYDILRVSRRADPAGVRMAYRRLAQKYHPDRLPGNADAQRIMAMINEAHDVLSDPARREGYDRWLAGRDDYARRARHLRLLAADAPVAAWPWCLLFATMAFAAAAIGTVLYKSVVPGVAVSVAHAGAAAQAALPPAGTKRN